jgi:hypothetical protein
MAFLIVSVMLLGLSAGTGPAQAKVPGPNGRILFARRQLDRDNIFRQTR